MRNAKVRDVWRNTNERKQYPVCLEEIIIENIDGFDSINIKLDSGISVFCGRNGTGKSTILKSIYKIVSNDEGFCSVLFDRINIENVEVKLKDSRGTITEYTSNDSNVYDKIEYFDPTDQSVAIIQKINSDANEQDWLEGIDASEVLNDNLSLVRRVTGKQYDSIEVFEIEGVLDQVFPIIKVKCKDVCYSNESMGLGEHKLLFMLWKIFTLERSSILLIEEPEAFLCPKSQEEFMNVLAYVSSSKHAIFLLSSHSEHIVSKIPLSSNVIFRNTPLKGVSTTNPRHSYKYLSALGLNSQKKGFLLVEDEFAGRVLDKILFKYDSNIYHDYYISNQKGESNLAKIIKHSQPGSGFNLMAIFDADCKGKINENEYSWPVFYLPGTQNLAPELLIIEDIKAKPSSYSERLNVDNNDFEEALMQEVDHHDFFIETANSLGLDLNLLKDISIDTWILFNEKIIAEFIFSLENYGGNVKAVIETDGEEVNARINDNILIEAIVNSDLIDISGLEDKQVTGKVGFLEGNLSFQVEV